MGPRCGDMKEGRKVDRSLKYEGSKYECVRDSIYTKVNVICRLHEGDNGGDVKVI